MEQSDQRFLDQIAKWINAEAKKINIIYNFGKGWEGWAQCDLAHYLLTENLKSTVEREQGVYEGKDWRVDLIYCGDEFNKWGHIAEIKCQIEGETDAHFRKRAEEDTNKITHQMWSSQAKATKWVLAFTRPTTSKLSGDWNKGPVMQDANGPQLQFRRFSGKL